MRIDSVIHICIPASRFNEPQAFSYGDDALNPQNIILSAVIYPSASLLRPGNPPDAIETGSVEFHHPAHGISDGRALPFGILPKRIFSPAFREIVVQG